MVYRVSPNANSTYQPSPIDVIGASKATHPDNERKASPGQDYSNNFLHIVHCFYYSYYLVAKIAFCFIMVMSTKVCLYEMVMLVYKTT